MRILDNGTYIDAEEKEAEIYELKKQLAIIRQLSMPRGGIPRKNMHRLRHSVKRYGSG